jgi:hypothetical protein
VWRADSNENAGFADFEAAEPMDHGDAMDAVLFVELLADFAHFGDGHGFVGFVVEIESGPIVRLIADEAVEGDDSAVLGSTDVEGQRSHIDGLADQLVDVIVWKCGHVDMSATAHGREKRDLVASPERRIPSGKFLIARSNHRGAVFCKLGLARGVKCEKLLDCSGVCELNGIFSMASEFLETAEKQDLHADRL